MRKTVLNLAMSLDGFIEDVNGGYDWCFTDQDYGMAEFFGNTNTIFIGRRSYELIAGSEDEYFPAIEKIYVFSDTLQPAHHKVEVITSSEFDVKVNAILEDTGPNIWLFGGASLISTFLDKRLITEMLISVHPLILGAGKPLFQDVKNMVDLMLMDTKSYDTGLVQLKYILKPIFDHSVLDVKFVNSGEDIY